MSHSSKDADGAEKLEVLQEKRMERMKQVFSDVISLETRDDVILPSDQNGTLESQESDSGLQWADQLPESRSSSSCGLLNVYQEMMIIYKQLKAERQNQQRWEEELHERERRLKQQEEDLRGLAGLKETIHVHVVTMEEKHQQELSQLQELLRERSKENRRLRSNFDTIRELNDNMKKQLNEVSEQNKKLETQYKRMQARLANLQRKYEQRMASRNCQKESVVTTETIKSCKAEKSTVSGKTGSKDNSHPTCLKLLGFILDWVDEQMFSSIKGSDAKGQSLPPKVVHNEKCLKVLPLLVDQLHHTSLSEPELLLNLVRLIYSTLRHLDSRAQALKFKKKTNLNEATTHERRTGDGLNYSAYGYRDFEERYVKKALSTTTLRRIGEEVSKRALQSGMLQSEEPDLHQSCIKAAGHLRIGPLYRSPCPHTRMLSILIILHTVTQADVLAQALDSLHTELMREESRGLFIHYGGLQLLLRNLRISRSGLDIPINILLRLTEQSCYLNSFLEACSCEEFFKTASQLLKNPCLDLPSLEKLTIILQKLSTIRKNRHLFEVSSLPSQIQELLQKTKTSHAFLCLNLRSILLNLK
ncbi:coiled-coil domain-containing protein 138 [Pholidichthys leucotaenia]